MEDFSDSPTSRAKPFELLFKPRHSLSSPFLTMCKGRDFIRKHKPVSFLLRPQ